MVELNYKDFWDEALSQLKKEIGEEKYGTWFTKIEYLRADEKGIYVSVPSKLFLEMFTPKYLHLIIAKIKEISGNDLGVFMEVKGKGIETAENTVQKPLPEEKGVQKGKKNISPDAADSIQAATDTPQVRVKKKSHPALHEEYNFDTYVVGEVNSYAFNAALAVARNPGNSKIYNPLLIYGGTGLGKTHLMQAIGHYIYSNSDLKILYITGEGFIRDFVETVGMGVKNMDAFAKKYRTVDTLLIDDIHTIEKRAGTQDELFYTFEALYNKKKQMVFTCDRPISELKNMAPRLISRFQWGINVQLQLPRYEELIAILKKKIELKRIELKKNIDISDEIIELIIKNISTNVRDMEGALNKMMGYADLVNKPVTLEIAQRELKDLFADPKQGNISIDNIQRVVADDFNLTPNDLKGKKKTASIVRPRQIAIYLCREFTDYSLGEIGQSFGNRDHTTMIHSCKVIEETSHSDTNLYNTLERLKRVIKEYNVK